MKRIEIAASLRERATAKTMYNYDYDLEKSIERCAMKVKVMYNERVMYLRLRKNIIKERRRWNLQPRQNANCVSATLYNRPIEKSSH